MLLRSLRIVKERCGPAGAATPTGRLCAIQNGSIQCYGEDGSLGRGVFLCMRTGGAISGRERDRAVAVEAWSSETLSDAGPGGPHQLLIEGDNGALLIAMQRRNQAAR